MYFQNVTECLRNDWKFQTNICEWLQLMDGNGLKWLDINGNGFNILEMFKFMMLLLWHQKCQGGVTSGFRSKTGMHC